VRAECCLCANHIPKARRPNWRPFSTCTADPGRFDAVASAQAPIREQSCNAEWALAQQTEALLAQFDSIEDAYLRERRHDVKQVADKVLKALLGHPGHAPLKTADEPTILVAHDLSPSDMVLFKRHPYAGFITDLGGTTSHTAILARSLASLGDGAAQRARLIQEGDLADRRRRCRRSHRRSRMKGHPRRIPPAPATSGAWNSRSCAA
jgi:hypothetical protein